MLNKKRSLSLSLVALTLAMAAGLSGQIRTTPASTAPPASANTPRLASLSYDLSQGSTAQVQQKPFESGRSVKNDVSRPLREVGLGPAPQWTNPREMPEPKGDGQAQAAPRPQVSDPVVQSSFGNGPVSALAAPAPLVNFAGLTNRNGVYPPDTMGDVGPNHFVQWVNSSIQIFNKSGVSLYGPTNGNTIWSGFGGPCQTTNDGDPIVLYDSAADRWMLSQFTASSPYGECIAISTTGDPTGSYYRYFFQLSTTVFYDYPKLGVWPDGYYMSANRFTSTFQGPAALVFDRAKMLLGQPATYQSFNLGTSYSTLLPSDLDGSRLPPTGAPNVFASKATNALQLWKFRVNWTTPSSSTFTGPTTLATAAYNDLCPSGTRSCVPQPGTTVKLDGLGDRLMQRLAYRNFGTYESLVATHSVNAASTGTQAGVRWYEIRNPAGTPTIYQQGTYAPDATNRWLGSVSQDGQGNIALVYSASSSSVYPGIRYAGRLTTDPLGTLGQTESTLKAGSGSQTGTASRWGDYAMMTIDPTDDCTFWMTSEYMPTTGTASWATWIGSFKFPNCGGAPPPTNTPVPAATNTPVPGATNTPVPTATNTPVPTATRTPAPQATPTNTPPPSSCAQSLTNGGFESGSAPWVQTSSGGYNLIDTTRPRTGSYSAYLGGYNSGTDTIYQQVTIPATATSATLTYWWNMSTQESGTTKYDYLYARVLDANGNTLTTLQTMSNADTQNTWKQSSFSLLAYKGQTVRIYFKGTTDSSLPTNFFVDDVSLNVCR